jgi:hypothetical protein
MRHYWTGIAALLLAVQVAMAQVPAADFIVAGNGNDQWTGKPAVPNAGNTDGPFATVQRAQQAARELRAAEANRAKPITILIRGGTYPLDKPLAFTPADSATAVAPTIFAAYPNELPVISGGVALKGFRNENGRWTLQIPEVQSGQWNFIQLFVNGERRMRPRLPKAGYYTIADKLDPSEKNKGKGYDRFKYANSDIRPDWTNLSDVEVLAFQTWTMARFRIDSVDDAQKIVNFTGRSAAMDGWSELPKGNRYLVENVKEALAEPGQWYLERKTGVLTYNPMPGEDPATAQVIAPKIESLVHITGDVGQQKWVAHLVFRGLTFAHTNWATPPQGNNFPQAEANLSGALVFSGARDCVVEQCKVTQVATYAIDFAAACKRNRVADCELTDLGAGGIKIGLLRNETNEELITSHHTIHNNLIAHGGRLHPAAIGVFIGHSPYNVVENNDIFDFYYTGVSVGWSWGYNPCGSHHNSIAYNHIYDIGQGVLSDMGGIYTLGLAEGTVLHHNLIHDIYAFSYGGWGIYFDEGTTHQVAENNIVYRAKTGGFHQHYGKENIVRNNIFAFARMDQIQRTRPEPHLSFTFERNIVYWNAGPLLGSNWSDNNYKMDYNLYWRTDGKAIEFSKFKKEEWNAKGQDVNSIIADPMFVDPEKGDFGLKAGSPAEKIGFKPIDITRTGRLNRTPGSSSASPAFPPVPPK